MDFDFIIIRSNHGKTKDDCFEYNANNCIENNIPIGVYCMNEIFPKENESKEEFIERFKEQVEKTLDTIKDYQIDYPVFLDLEGKEIEEEYLKEMFIYMGRRNIKKWLYSWYIFKPIRNGLYNGKR